MVVKSVANIADEAKVRFGWLALIMAALFMGASVTLFLSTDVKVMGMDLSGDEETFGWYFTSLGMLFAFAGLFLAITIESGD